MAPPVVTSQKSQAITRAAAQRAPQRYLNRASGKMESPQQMRGYRGRPQQQGSTIQRSTTTRIVAPAQPPSLIQMTPAQIEDRAKRIVNSEVAAERLPFQQRQQQLTGEQAGVEAAHNADYGQLDAGIAAQQGKQAESAKTLQNEAADRLKRAEQGTPGSAETNEHLGGAPAPGSSLARQQEAARTLLTAIASSAQGGTSARQQSEADFLTNLKGTAAQEAAGGRRQIAGEYGKRRQEVGAEDARTLATKPGRVGKLVLGMEGEQEKLRIAAQGLNLKGAEAERHSEETQSNISTRKQTQGLNQRKLNLAERKQGSDEAYKRATAPDKKLKDQLDTKKKEIEIKKALEGNPHKAALTPDQINGLSGEAAKVFNVFKRARENGATPAQIREALTRGFFRRVPNKKEAEEKKKPYNEKTGLDLKQPIWLDVAEQIMQKEYVDAPTKQRLREMGLPDSEWSNHFLGGPKKAKPQSGLKRTNYKPKGK